MKMFRVSCAVLMLDAAAYAATESLCDVEYPSYLGDGYCNTGTSYGRGEYNIAACDWDGGDCCESTCVSSTYTCGELPPAPGIGRNDSLTIGFPRCYNPAITCYQYDEVTMGDGFCDFGASGKPDLNTLSCDWDGGDCCQRTCVDGAASCGVGEDGTQIGFQHCLDPAGRPTGAPIDGLELCTGSIYFYQNAACNSDLNNANCQWDGGDCCLQSCTTSDATGGYTACGSFDCQDPDYDLVARGFSADCVVDVESWIADGYCDTDGNYNTELCSWDGGDCCSDTCEDTSIYNCGGSSPFVCNDPDDPNYNSCPSTVGKRRAQPGNGLCDDSGTDDANVLNTLRCDWDGGDCCPSTCIGVNNTECGNLEYTCLDPTATEVGSSGVCQIEYTSYLGDGACDTTGNYNTAACGWDRGDCCPSTCVTYPDGYTCGARPFYCVDPDAMENADYTGPCQATPISAVGDGYCDGGVFNTAECGYDGGDCCEATCDATGKLWYCGTQAYDNIYQYVGFPSCDDPLNQPPTTTAPPSSAPETGSGIGNGANNGNVQVSPVNVGGIVGGVIGALVVIAIVVVLIYVFVIRGRNHYVSQKDEDGTGHTQATNAYQGSEPNAI